MKVSAERTVLVVDTDELLGGVVCKFLTLWGYNVRFVRSLSKLRFELEDVDLVILDRRIGHARESDLLARWLVESKGISVLRFTSDAPSTIPTTARPQGVLSKPPRGDFATDLRQSVESILAESEAHQRLSA